MSLKTTTPASSVRIENENGSHSTSCWADFLAFLDLELGAVNDLVTLALAALGVGDDHPAAAVHDDGLALLVLDRGQALEGDDARVLRFDRRLLGTERGRAADVERAHGELGSGFADRLGGDDAHRHADFDDLAGGEIASVAQGADAARGGAGQNRADADVIDARRVHVSGLVFGDFLVGAHDDAAAERIADVHAR